MKKLLITTLFITALSAFAPAASAECPDRAFVGYDRHGHPVFREVYRPAYEYREPRYDRYYEERPVYYREAPRSRHRDSDDDRCRPQKRSSHRSPLAFLFNF